MTTDFSVTVRTNDSIGKDSATVWVSHDADTKTATFYSDGNRDDSNKIKTIEDVYHTQFAAEDAAGIAYRVIR